jgi:hypothetical protein
VEHFLGSATSISSWRRVWFRRDRCSGASPTSARRSTGTSRALAQEGEDLPDESNRLFVVICKGCHRPLVTVERLRNPEIALVVDHLRACSPSEPLGDEPMLGDILRYLRIGQADQG